MDDFDGTGGLHLRRRTRYGRRGAVVMPEPAEPVAAPVATWRKVVAAILDFLTAFFVGGHVIGRLTGNLTEGGFALEGAPALALFAVIIAYFVVFARYLGGTLWQRLLGVR
jgi:hypothetical protein